MVVAKIATLQLGANQYSKGLPIGRASEMLNVSERSAHRAREVLDKGVPELAEKVERGEISVSAAADIARLPKEEQCEIVARAPRRAAAQGNGGAWRETMSKPPGPAQASPGAIFI
jgi:hypothetical protein